jgi:hypothetical protein
MTERVKRADAEAHEHPPAPAFKHCWVIDDHGRLPALLLEWRRIQGAFEGRVVHAVRDADGEWILVEEWLPAGLLAPA